MAGRIKGVTVEIGGDVTKLDKAIKGVNDNIKDTQSKLRDVERLLKLDPTNTELLAQKQQLLSQAVQDTGKKLEALKEAEKQAQEQFQRGDITQAQYQGLQREIINTEQKLKDLQEQAEKSNAVLQQISAAGEKFQEVGETIADVGEKLMPITAVVTGVGVASVAAAADFEDAMAKLSTIADTSEETGVPIEQLEDQIRSLSDQTGISASVIANNVYDAISAGQKTGDAVNFVSKATTLAKAGFTSSASALDILTTIMNAYKLEAEDVGKISDILINTQNLGKTTVDQLASSMGKVIPTAKAQGVSIENLAAMYAVMTSNGIATAESTTYLNSMLNELGKQGTTAADAFAAGTEHIKEGGLTMAEAMESGWSLTDVLAVLDEQAADSGTSIANMFGSSEAGKAASILWNNSQKLNKTVAQMGNSAGATQSAFDKLDTTSNKVNIALNQVKNAGIELGGTILDMLMPYIEGLAEKIQAVTTWFNNLDDETQQTIVTVMAIVAALGPLLIIIGKVISTVGTVMTILPQLSGVLTALTGPVGIVIAAIAGIIAILVVLWNNCEGFRDAVTAVWEVIKEAFQGFVDWLQATFAPVWGAIIGAAQAIFQTFQGALSAAWGAITSVFQIFTDFLQGVFGVTWENVFTGVQSGMETAGSVIQTVVGVLTDIFGALVSFLADVFLFRFKATLDNLISYFTAIKDNIIQIVDGVKTAFQGIIDFVVGVFTGNWERAWNGVKRIFSGVFESLVGIAKTPINGVIACLNGAISGINTMVQALNNLKFTVPDWVPGIGGQSFGFNLPQIGSIPYLAKGGILESGSAVVGEKGPELLSLMNGKARVTPLTDSGSEGQSTAAPVAGAGSFNQTLNFYTAAMSPSEVARQTRNSTRQMLSRVRG